MNHIMCPLDADPFRGQLYRTGVFFHQGILCPLVCKSYVLLASYFLTKCKYTKIKDSLNCDSSLGSDRDNMVVKAE